MLLANYHTHTVRCLHAVGTERQYIEKAIEKGFKCLGFSDHVPQPFPDGFVSFIRMKMDEIPDYIGTLTELREEYKDRIEILIGFEVEYYESIFPQLMDELRKYPLDYMILGQHHVPGEWNGFYSGSATDSEDKLKQYVEMTIKGMRTGHFTYLAHPDLIHYIGDDETYRKHMKDIVTEAISLDMPLEVNLYGFLDERHYPCDRFFSMASEMGAKFVIGCDAHHPDVIRQPEEMPEFIDFLTRNNIEYLKEIKVKKPF